jgi:glycolate oxidase FAD binding subunit
VTADGAGGELFEALRRAVGSEHLRAAPNLQVQGVEPAVQVQPATAAELAACLRAACERGAAVIPWGGGTLQRLGSPPERADILLDCGRLVGIVDWEPADLTAGILAGTTLAAAQAQLAQQGQQLALDAPGAERATVGGLVAANVCGPRRWLYGGWRDQIIGMEMVLTNGDVIKSGGRVVKNVQGYDLAKLFTGSLGTLGVITRVNVKLAPLLQARRLIVARGGLEQLDGLLAAVAASTLRVATLDLLDAPAAEVCGLGGAGAAALLLLEGTTALVDGQSVRLARVAAEHGLATEAAEGDAFLGLYRRRLDLDRLDEIAENEARLRVGVLPSAAAAAMDEMRAAAEQRGLVCRCWAETGDGIVSAHVAGPEGDLSVRLPALQGALLAHLPSMTVVCGDPGIQRMVRAWGAEPAGLDIMRGLKRRFDPTRTLQPGRYAGGI